MWDCPNCHRNGVPYKKTGLCKDCAEIRAGRALQQRKLLCELGDIADQLDVKEIINKNAYYEYFNRLDQYIKAVND